MRKQLKEIKLGQIDKFIAEYKQYFENRINPDLEKSYTKARQMSKELQSHKADVIKAANKIPPLVDRFNTLYASYIAAANELGTEPDKELVDLSKNVKFWADSVEKEMDRELSDHKSELAKLQKIAF